MITLSQIWYRHTPTRLCNHCSLLTLVKYLPDVRATAAAYFTALGCPHANGGMLFVAEAVD